MKQKNPNVKELVISAISLRQSGCDGRGKRRVTDRYGSYTDMCVAFSCSGAVSYDDRNESVYIISAGGKEDGFGNFDHGDLQRKRENSGGVRTYGGISGSK